MVDFYYHIFIVIYQSYNSLLNKITLLLFLIFCSDNNKVSNDNLLL